MFNKLINSIIELRRLATRVRVTAEPVDNVVDMQARRRERCEREKGVDTKIDYGKVSRCRCKERVLPEK